MGTALDAQAIGLGVSDPYSSVEAGRANANPTLTLALVNNNQGEPFTI